MGEPARTRCQRPDGVALTVWDWPAPAHSAGQVLLVHGLGEHARRYDAMAQRWIAMGWSVRAYDQRGHGTSDGPRGGLPHRDALLDDWDAVLDATRAQHPGPLLVLGHSMGGLVSAAAIWRRSQAGLPLPQALILSSPALDVGMGVATRALLALLNRWAPNLTVGNGLSLDQLCHDPAVTQAYVADPLVHARISVRLAGFFQHWGPCVLSQAQRWPLATLVLYAQADALVRASGSASFAEAASQGGAPVEAQGFEGLFHEIFNEPEAMAAPVWRRLQAWLQTAPGQKVLSP